MKETSSREMSIDGCNNDINDFTQKCSRCRTIQGNDASLNASVGSHPHPQQTKRSDNFHQKPLLLRQWSTTKSKWRPPNVDNIRFKIKMSGLLVSAMILALLLGSASGSQGRRVFTDCGSHLQDSQGVIQTPDFPNRFPMPIRCRWVIRAPDHYKIVLYFTQFYLRHSFFISEYDDYKSPSDYFNKNSLGKIDAMDNVNHIVSYRPNVVIDLVVSDTQHLHLRVEEFLREVHGFNITYHIVPRNESIQKGYCSAHVCSYLGHCLASADYSSYKCHCFEGYYGQYCEKGPHCDPDRGINMCYNGGVCRYVYGSLVNMCECPKGYHGAKCEEKPLDPTGGECLRLNCDHFCEVSDETNDIYCACEEGYRLKEDGRMCVEEELYRITVTLPVMDQPHLEDNLDELREDLDFVHSRYPIVLQLSMQTVRDFQVDVISSKKIQYHFLVEKSELDYVRPSVLQLVRRNMFLSVAINSSNVEIGQHPDTKLLTVSNADRGPALESKLLTLVCTARGSSNLQFRWFKDGRPFDTARTHRNAWQIRLPETIEEKQILVLNIDGVTTYDEGVFTCEISDYGYNVSKSFHLEVLPHPQVMVTPLTISAIKGTAQTFRCLALDDNASEFKYAWRKNGRPIDSADRETVEQLIPSGSRLVIPSAIENSNYTCEVTNKAGTAVKTTYLFVADASSASLMCPPNSMEGVRWPKAFGGYFSMQKCPSDAEGITRGLADGSASRRCVCTKNSTCAWERPNYAKCQSVHLIEIYDKVMKIQLGYYEDSLVDSYKSLYHIARIAQGRMFAGDLDIAAKVLNTILALAKDFPGSVSQPFNVTELVDFFNILLREAQRMTAEEQGELRVGARLTRMVEMMVDLHRIKLLNLTDVPGKVINITMGEVIVPPEVSNSTKKDGKRGRRTIAEDRSAAGKSDNKDGSSDGKVKVMNILKASYSQTILPLLERGNRLRPSEEKFASDIYSFLPLNTSEPTDKKYSVELPYIDDREPFNPFQAMISPAEGLSCMSWIRNKRNETDGTWTNTSCTVLTANGTLAKCLCALPGHFVVTLVPVNSTRIVIPTEPSYLILVVTCAVSLTFLAFTIIGYLLAWSHILEGSHCLHFNIILSVFGINLVCTICLLHPEEMVMCIVTKMALQLFTVSAATFLLLDVVHTLLEIIARNKCQTASGTFKLFYIGWGVPALSIFFALIILELYGYDKKCSVWCWWTPAESHFKGMLFLMGILYMGHLGVVVSAVALVNRWKDEWRFLDRRKHLMDMAFSNIMMIILGLLVIFGMVYSEEPDTGDQIVFLVFDLSLTVMIVVFLFIQQKEIRYTAQMHCHSYVHALRIPTVKNPLPMAPPASQEENAAEVERMHAYCESIDRQRYTSEHKRQLRFLLNSSSSSGSSGVAVTPQAKHRVPQKRRSHTRGARQKTKNATNADSGISEGTESEKSSTTPPLDCNGEFLQTDKDKQLEAHTYVNEAAAQKKSLTQKCKCLHSHNKKNLPKAATSASLRSTSSRSSSTSSSSSKRLPVQLHSVAVPHVVIDKASGAIPKRKYTTNQSSYPSESVALNKGFTKDLSEEAKESDILIGTTEVEVECHL